MTVWFTSDTHFGSERTLELSRRPFKDTREMDAEILKHWIELFEPGDELYHLGDFGEFQPAMGILASLGVKCHLVLGNYEEDAIAKDEMTPDEIREIGFASVDREVDGFAGDVRLVHRPEDCVKDGSRFNLFGHIHGRQSVKRHGLDVGVDAHHFRPVSLETAKWYRNAIENHYDDNVFE